MLASHDAQQLVTVRLKMGQSSSRFVVVFLNTAIDSRPSMNWSPLLRITTPDGSCSIIIVGRPQLSSAGLDRRQTRQYL